MFSSLLQKSVLGTATRASRLNARPLLARAYHEKVISHYENPRNVSGFAPTDCACASLSGGSHYLITPLPRSDPSQRTTSMSELVSSGPQRTLPLLISLRHHRIIHHPGSLRCGDVMKLQIRVDEDGVISDVKFKTFGCGSAIASSSYMTERVKGLSLEEAGMIKNTEIAKELCLPPVKLHCSSACFLTISRRDVLLTGCFSPAVLAEDAIRSAIRDYKKKREGLANPKQRGFIDVTQSPVTGETHATPHPGAA